MKNYWLQVIRFEEMARQAMAEFGTEKMSQERFLDIFDKYRKQYGPFGLLVNSNWPAVKIVVESVGVDYYWGEGG